MQNTEKAEKKIKKAKEDIQTDTSAETNTDTMTVEELRVFYSQPNWSKGSLRDQILKIHQPNMKLPQHRTKNELVEILVCFMRNLPQPEHKREKRKKKSSAGQSESAGRLKRKRISQPQRISGETKSAKEIKGTNQFA